MLFNDATLPDKTLREQVEAKNHQTALLFLFDHVSAAKPLDEDLVLHLHTMLMNGIMPDAGRCRRHGVRIVGTDLPTANYLKVPSLRQRPSARGSSRLTPSQTETAGSGVCCCTGCCCGRTCRRQSSGRSASVSTTRTLTPLNREGTRANSNLFFAMVYWKGDALLKGRTSRSARHGMADAGQRHDRDPVNRSQRCLDLASISGLTKVFDAEFLANELPNLISR